MLKSEFRIFTPKLKSAKNAHKAFQDEFVYFSIISMDSEWVPPWEFKHLIKTSQ